MHVAKLELTNWGPFAGEHVIELEPTTYGIVGPNWSGKSRLISAVPFALYGTNPERLEDEWITRGAASGMVALTLSTGVRVERGRRRGKSTQVVVKSGGAEMQGGQALDEIGRLVVLDEDEFFMSCYLRQKRIGQLVTMLPSDRVRVLSGWIGLEQADRAIDIAGGLLEVVESELEGSERELKQACDWIDAACAEHGIAEDPVRIARTVALQAHLAQQLADAEAEVARVTADAEDEASRQREQEYARLVVEGKQAKAALAAMQSAAELKVGRDAAAKSVAETDGEIGSAKADRRRALAIIEGEFDGTCPVVGIQCPAREQLEAAIAEAEQRVSDVDLRFAELELRRSEAATIEREWAELERVRSTREERLDAMRERAAKLIAELGKARAAELAKAGPDATDEDELATRRRVHAERLVAAGQALEAARARHADVCATIDDFGGLEARVLEHRLRARVAGAAVVVCERARREVMRASAGEIERGANKVLGQCGVGLEVAFRWEREGKGHAKNCAECGAGFPPSAKVKECARCGAKRGPLMTDKLELVPSDVSGAAEDLAGVAVQLSAARWLRARKGAPWSTAFVDEPFGALDVDNRRALAQHLAAALAGEGGFRQALVVAHQPDALGGMQRRIEIVPGPGGSRCVVS